MAGHTVPPSLEESQVIAWSIAANVWDRIVAIFWSVDQPPRPTPILNMAAPVDQVARGFLQT